jgi:hypothetical protein
LGASSAVAAAPDADFVAVYAASDDAALNTAYAQSRAKAGDLIAAAAAVERILLAQPNAHAIRLFYAQLLYRLDDDQAALRELDLLNSVNLSQTDREQTLRLRRSITHRDAPVRIDGQISTGLGFDSDAGNALVSGLDFAGALPSISGATWTSAGQVNGAKRIGDGTELVGHIGWRSQSDISGPDQGFIQGEAAIGVSLAGATSVRMQAFGRTISLLGAHYLTEYGVRGDARVRLNSHITVIGNISVLQQQFTEPLGALLPPPGVSRNGTRVEVDIGFTQRMRVGENLAIGIGYGAKASEYAPLGYSGVYGYAAYSALLGGGAYLALRADIRRLAYHEVDPFTGLARAQTRSSARAAIGLPLRFISEAVVAEAALNYRHRSSDSPYLGYASTGGELRLIYRFGK